MTNIRSKARVNTLEEEFPMNRSAVLEQPPAPPTSTPHRYSDPAVRVKVNCGCGFFSTSLTDAAGHAKSLGHTLTISGEVRAQF